MVTWAAGATPQPPPIQNFAQRSRARRNVPACVHELGGGQPKRWPDGHGAAAPAAAAAAAVAALMVAAQGQRRGGRAKLSAAPQGVCQQGSRPLADRPRRAPTVSVLRLRQPPRPSRAPRVARPPRRGRDGRAPRPPRRGPQGFGAPARRPRGRAGGPAARGATGGRSGRQRRRRRAGRRGVGRRGGGAARPMGRRWGPHGAPRDRPAGPRRSRDGRRAAGANAVDGERGGRQPHAAMQPTRKHGAAPRASRSAPCRPPTQGVGDGGRPHDLVGTPSSGGGARPAGEARARLAAPRLAATNGWSAPRRRPASTWRG